MSWYSNNILCSFQRCVSRYLPDLIKGDMDSIQNDVRSYYASCVSLHAVAESWSICPDDLCKGVPIVEDHDTGSTDLMKCVLAVQEGEQTQVEFCLLLQFSSSDVRYLAIRYYHSRRTIGPSRPNYLHTFIPTQTS